MQRSEDFRRCACSSKKQGFSQAQELSQKQSDKNTAIKLVVVMSAVDWWKSSRTRTRLDDSSTGVTWISGRNCGKSEW
jgi:hypothetical protein